MNPDANKPYDVTRLAEDWDREMAQLKAEHDQRVWNIERHERACKWLVLFLCVAPVVGSFLVVLLIKLGWVL